MLVDNQPAVHTANNPVNSKASRHFEIKMHAARGAVLSGAITVKHCPGALMIADILSKPFTGDKRAIFEGLRKQLLNDEVNPDTKGKIKGGAPGSRNQGPHRTPERASGAGVETEGPNPETLALATATDGTEPMA